MQLPTNGGLQEWCGKFDAGVFDQNNPAIALKLDFVALWLAKGSIASAMDKGAQSYHFLMSRLQCSSIGDGFLRLEAYSRIRVKRKVTKGPVAGWLYTSLLSLTS